jgi:demethylmenaquinone methyltransferase/2-methoxy-6-polyprenyl-1,4-benzoquinol methylase
MTEKSPRKIEKMFSAIAPSYDMLNLLLSAGRDRQWRKEGIRKLSPGNGIYLDLACGTCDLALEMRRQGADAKIVAADFSHEMLLLGKEKVNGSNIRIVRGDALSLAFPDDVFTGVTCAYGIRNFENLEKGITEILRVLKPGGRAVILEFTTPSNRLVRAAYLFYFTRILPLIGGIVSGNFEAYSYLPRSAINFPDRNRLLGIFRSAGFAGVEVTPLTFGICDLLYAEKPIHEHSR